MLRSQVQSCKIIVDGGCLRNGGENPKGYGSFKVFVNEKEIRHEQFDLTTDITNNQAEWDSMISCLEYIATDAMRASLLWTIRTDSTLVCNQIRGTWKCKDDILKIKQMFAQDYIKANNLHVTFEPISGAEVKKILGH